jgi:hypothetical protein
MHTLISAFDDRQAARRAVNRLIESGVAREDLHLQEDPVPERAVTIGDRAVASAEREVAVGHGGLAAIVDFFGRLFGDHGEHHAGTWSEAVRRGHSVVVVDARDDEAAERAAVVLHECGAVDVDERVTQWRADGWTPAEAAGDAPSPPLGRLPADRGGVRVLPGGGREPLREIATVPSEDVVLEADEPRAPDFRR